MGDDPNDIQRRSPGAPGDSRPDLWQGAHVRVEALSEYLDAPEEFTPDERATIDAHLTNCAECRVAAADLQALVAALAALPEPATPRSFALTADMLAARDLPRALEPARLSPRRERQMALLQRVTAVAAVLFVFVLGIDAFTRAGGLTSDSVTYTSAPESAQQSLATSAEPAEDAARNAATVETGEAPNVAGASAPQPTEPLDTGTEATAAATSGAQAAETPQGDDSAAAIEPTEDTSTAALTTQSVVPAAAFSVPADDADNSNWGMLGFGCALLLVWLLAAIVILPRLGGDDQSGSTATSPRGQPSHADHQE